MIGMNGNKRAILNFHGIGHCDRPFEHGEQDVWVSEARFAEFADEIAAFGCEITFDDGNKSDVEIALPILLSRGLHGKFFILTGRVGAPGFLDARDIQTLLANGMEVGLHGRDHVSWREIDDESLQCEIEEAKGVLEAITGRAVTEAACPFGEYARRPLHRLRSAGFDAVYTSDGGVADFGAWLRPRRTVRSTENPELVRRLFQESLTTRLFRSAKMFVKRSR